MPIVLEIAITHLLFRKRQSIVSMLGVALGVGFFIAVSSLMRGSQNDFIETLVEASPHISMRDEFRDPPVQPVEIFYEGGAVKLRSLKPRDEVRGLRNYKWIAEGLSGLDGAVISPALSGQVILRYGAKDRAATLTGIDPDVERRVTKLEEDIVEGSLSDLKTAANGIMMGRLLAEQLSLDLNDTISVVSPSGAVFKMKVVALFSSGVPLKDLGVLYALLRNTQVVLDKPNTANEIRIKLADPEAAQTVAAEIENRYNYKTESWQEANEDLLAAFVVRNAIMYAIVGAITVVAGFGIFNVISTVVLEKNRDIAILKSMGYREGDIRRIFVLEGAAVGVIGALLGWGVGYGLQFGLSQIEFEISGIVEMQRLPLDYGFDQYLIAASFAIFSAVLAAYIPARRAARLRPVEIIRGAA